MLALAGCGGGGGSDGADNTGDTVDTSDETSDDTASDDTTEEVAESLGLADIDLRDSGAALVADFYTPEPMSERLAETRSIIWSALSGAPENLTRFSFGESGSNDIFVVSDSGGIIDDNLVAESDLATSNLVENDLLLRGIFQCVEVASGEYAIFSTKHGNYALDVADDGVSLILHNARGLEAYEAASASFLTFSIGASPSILTANNRYIMNAADSTDGETLAYDPDGSWTNKEVVINGTGLELAATGGAVMNLYAAPIDLAIPHDFNPDDVTRVTNPEYYSTDAYEGDLFATGINGIDDKYAAQVAEQGANADTLAAAEAMLDEIETALATQGSQMRYRREFYLALREGLFQRTLQSLEAADASIGTLTVPYVYFTNETDEHGDYHPFMVIASRSAPDTLALLGDIPRPPGGGSAANYDDQNVTRSFYLENFLLRIPMRDYGEVDAVAENDLQDVGSLADDAGESNYDHHNYAGTGATAVAIDGVVIYPSYNNTLNFSQEAGELSARGMHSGRGLGVHYHADSHSAALASTTTDTGLDLYNEADYTSNHPPIVSIGFDGVAGYGFYRDDDTDSDGVNVALDEFGGHEHDDYGYHYHALSTDRLSENANSYTTHELGPLGAWAGRINYVPDFQQIDNRSVWLGNAE